MLLLALGCAEERPAIDRVQPFALEKSFFVGEDLQDPTDNPEFWTQATLIDVGYGAAQSGLFTSTYAQPMSRIRWQITEDLLIARLAYERIDGSDGKGIGDKTMEGVIVAAFDIEKHFDIVNAYNPTTGEKLNILEENSSDRPWYQREFVRVDFSKNRNVDSYDFDTLSLMGVYGGIEYESLAYYVDDPTHPDAPYFDDKSDYFDITTKAFAKPGVVDLSHLGWGIDSFPACFLDNDFFGGSSPSGSCSPVELTIRHAFRRVVDSDYEPTNWDGYRFQAYGGFYVERYGYARNYGMSDDNWHRFLTRYQIWERSHYYDDLDKMEGPVVCFTPDTTKPGQDPHRDENGDGTEDECKAVTDKLKIGGSRCDEFRQMCTLPYQAREPITIAWYYTEGGNPEYFEATALATHNWDVALRTAVRTAKYTECLKVGTDKDVCKKDYPMYFGQQDDNDDAMTLALEVDDCRNGVAYYDKKRDEKKCQALADELGKKRGVAAEVISIARMPEMIVLCHSPVLYTDPTGCGDRRLPKDHTPEQCDQKIEEAEAFLALDEGELEPAEDAIYQACKNAVRVRRGDLRYHQINGIIEPQTPSPWGIYTDAEDPLTGETISASVNVWTWVNDLWAQKVVDQLRYIGGELTTADVTDADYVADWASAARAASGGSSLPQMTRKQLSSRISEITGGVAGDAFADAHKFAQMHPEAIKQTLKLKRDFQGVAAANDAGSTTSPIYAARRKSAEGSGVEAKLMNRMMQQFFGIEGMPMTDGLMDLVSPLRGGNPSVMREVERMRDTALAKQGMCVLYEADAPLALTGLSDILQYKFGKFNPSDSLDVQYARAAGMARYIARRAHMGVIVHEMGHSVGMRHNFVSSSDAFGFRPQYWQLRTGNGKTSKLCEDLDPSGESCVGPRYFDPLTDNEKSNLIHMWMHSSVMEYAGETTQDFLGIGAYDFATMRMFYGDAVSVHSDDSYKVGTPRAQGMLAKVDNFGGILGMQPRHGEEDIHYSQYQDKFELIQDCKPVDPALFKPARYNAEIMGVWDPVLDGHIVFVDGAYSRCHQQKVDYVSWTSLRAPTDGEFSGYFRGDRAVDEEGRTRVPYGFATDRWADLGNLSVYRHDNGADAYEIFDFLITQQEVGHIWDNFRRGRQGFSVRSAAMRTLGRFNEKIRDGAKGLGLMSNVYKDYSAAIGYDFDTFWPSVAPLFFTENLLASGLAFDHLTRTASRPEAGPHYVGDKVLRSVEDSPGNPGETVVVVPNGATGKYGNVAAGGRPVENRLASDQGEYDSELTINAGSYYDKVYTAMLLTESVDNFISDSRLDFIDARYRAVSLADLFPEGYRRFLANSLTGDDHIKGPRVAADKNGKPLTGSDGFPEKAIGWTTWWGEKPTSCFPDKDSTVCTSYGSDSAPYGDDTPAYTAVIDPQIGWEEQKFLIAWTMLYLPENQQQWWIDMMRIWELGKDADPEFDNRVEFHNPTGKTYIAKSFGQEYIFGKQVERGIAARVLQYANDLMYKAYSTDPGPDLNGDGDPDWFIPLFNADTGKPLVKWDPSIAAIEDGYVKQGGREGCNANDNSDCTCASNRACLELQKYVEIPFFLRQTLDAYDLASPHTKGIYD